MGAAMTIDPGPEIRRLFGQAALEHEAVRNLTGEELAEYRKIHENHAARVRFEERQFELEYPARFDAARRRIIDQGGMKDRKLAPRWAGSDKFSASEIDRQAGRDVRQAHDDLLIQLKAQRTAAIESVFEASEQRQSGQDHIKTDFTNAVDRRSGPDRRQGPSR
jgi:ribosomal protein L29